MPTPEEVLGEWYQRVTATQKGHYYAAHRFHKANYLLGVPVMALTTLVGTSVFASLQQQRLEPRSQIIIGLASVAAAVLASLQTFLGFADRAEKHRVSGARYGAIGRELEEMLASPGEDSLRHLPGIRQRLDALALESPNVPIRLYRYAKMSLREDPLLVQRPTKP